MPIEVIKKRIKHFYYQIYQDKIVVKCNYSINNSQILEILNSNRAKLEKRFKLISTLKQNAIYFLGKEVSIIKDENITTFKFIEQKLYINSNANLEEVKNSFYKSLAPKILLPRVEYFSKIMDLTPTKVSFRKAKTRWGSCSYKNSISLNIALVGLPNYLSDYVIVHELAHIKHKNHSKEFWKEVEKYYPNYIKAKKELKSFSLIL